MGKKYGSDAKATGGKKAMGQGKPKGRKGAC